MFSATAAAGEFRSATRHGAVTVALEVASDSTPVWRLNFGGCTLVETEYDRLSVEQVLESATRDYVVVRRSTGGIACPYQFLVLEIAAGGRTTLGPEFGSCLEPEAIRLEGEALILEMPAYAPHPELLTSRERRRRRRTTEIYTVRGGVVEKREELRSDSAG